MCSASARIVGAVGGLCLVFGLISPSAADPSNTVTFNGRQYRARRYLVARPIDPPCERDEVVTTVKRPVTETVEREEVYTVRKPVVETVEREETYTVLRPVIERLQRSETVVERQPTTTWVTEYSGGAWTQVPRTVYVERVVTRQVPVEACRYIEVQRVRRVPVETIRYVEEQRVRKVAVASQPWVEEKLVEEQVVRKEPAAATKLVYEERIELVPIENSADQEPAATEPARVEPAPSTFQQEPTLAPPRPNVGPPTPAPSLKPQEKVGAQETQRPATDTSSGEFYDKLVPVKRPTIGLR
jgi:YTV protein